VNPTINEIYSRRMIKEWLKAVKDELDNMKKLKVYEVVNKLPENSNVVTSGGYSDINIIQIIL